MSAAEHLPNEMSEEFLDEHVGHVDERWLMSYADMMTLLFGLFVMLYAMMDQFDVIQQSAGMKFSSSKEMGGTKEDPAVAIQILENALEKVKIENETLRVKVEALETTLTAEKAKVAEANAMMEVIKTKAETVVPDQMTQIAALEIERDALRAQVAKLNNEVLEAAAASRNQDNIPQTNESRTRMRSDGLGGGGGGGEGGRGGGKPAPRHVYEVQITMPDQTIITRKSKALGPNGVQIDDMIVIAPGQKVELKISTAEGQSIYLKAKAMEGDDGKTSNRLRFIAFPNGDQAKIQEWISRPPPAPKDL